MHRARACIVAAVVATAAACAPHPSPDELAAQFAEAERLCLEGEFADAKVMLKQYLLHDPTNPGAHYYLARTYMLSKDFRPAMAEGEFQTALRLFLRQDRESGIKRFKPEYFEMMCYLDSARVLYLHCVGGLSAGASPRLFDEPLQRALGYVDKARTVMPKAPEVDQIGDPIRELAAEIGGS